MGTGHVEMCSLPARCQKFDLGLYFLAYSGWQRYRLSLGAAPKGSGKMEPPTQRPGEAEPPTQRSGEVEPAHLGSVGAVVALLTARMNQC